MKNTDKTQPKQGQGRIKPRVRPAKVEQAKEERKQVEAALRESEEKYRSLVERANDGITIIQDGVVKFANTRLVEMWGSTVEEVLETPFANHIHPDELPAMVEHYQQRMAGENVPPMYETVLLRRDGSKVYVEINAGVIAYLGKPADLVMVRDVTERKLAEVALRQRAEELAALQATVLEIATPHDLPSLLHTIVERAARLLNTNSGGMYLCDPARDEVRCVVSYKTAQDYTGTVLKYGEGAAGMVAQSGKPLVIDDYRSWGGRAAAFDAEQPFMAVLSAPMIWQGQVMGVIHVLHDMEGRLFSQAELDLLTQFANHAAVAVENARLYDEAQQEIVERKRIEQELQALSSRNEAILASVLDIIMEVDKDKVYTWANRAGIEFFGEGVVGKEADFYFEGEQETYDVVQPLFSGSENIIYVESWQRRRDGEKRLLAWWCRVLKDVEGNVTGALSTARDITERKQAEEALRLAEEKYRAIFENAIDGIFQSTLEGRFITVNPAFARMLGYASPQEMIATVTDIAQQVYVEAPHRDEFMRLMAEQGSVSGFEFQMRRKDGSTLWVSENVRSVRDAEGRILYYEGTVENITDRKLAEKQLQESEAKYRSLFEDVPDGVYRTTPDGLILAANLALVSMLGYDSQEELLKTHITDLYLEPGDRKNMVSQLQESDVIRNAEIRLKRKNGTPIVALDNAHAVRDEHGEVLYFEGTLTDITTLKQAEAALEHRLTELEVLYDSGLKLSRLLEPREVGQQIIEVLEQRLKWHHITIRLYHPERESLELLALGQPGIKDEAERREVEERFKALVARPGHGLSGWVVQHGESIRCGNVSKDDRYVDTYPGLRSGLYVPLKIGERIIGVISVESEQEDAFSESDERLLSTLAAQAAVTLENARLFAETSLRLKHVQALRTIDMAISSSLDLQVTFDIFLEQATRQLEVHAADILLLNPHTQTLEYIAGRGFRTNALQHTHLRLGEGYAGMAGLERKIIHISDLRNRKTDFLRSPFISSEGFETCFCVPLIAKGLVKGVLEIFHRAPLEADQEWLDFVDTLAGQAAIAIDNVTLFNDLQRSNVELTLAYDATIEGWSHALDLRDKETEGHAQRVADLTLRLAQAMGVSDHELIHIRRGSLLHDIGKMGIPDEILRKPAALDEQEWVVMHQHPLYAHDMLSPISYLRPAMDIPYCHHEKWDGSGYPRGLKGEQIPLAARLFAVVDVYDALTSDRTYRKAWSRKKALEYIQQQAGQHFDPEIVSAFMGMPALHELRNGDKISQT